MIGYSKGLRMNTIADLLRAGDPVFVDSLEGFGGPAVVTEVRDSAFTKCKVRMLDGSQPEFWAHDFELSARSAEAGRYDSRADTLEHIGTVRRHIELVRKLLYGRQLGHDLSKLGDPEKAAFDEFTPKLKGST